MAKTRKKANDSNWDDDDSASQTHTVILGNPDRIADRIYREKYDRPEIIREAVIIDGVELSVTYNVERKTGIETTTKKCPDPVHDDLRAAFHKLTDHLGRLCYQPLTEHNPLHKQDKTQPALICPNRCVGFKLKGKEDNEGVMLFGERTLPNAKTIELKSPLQKFMGDIHEYEHSEELKEIVQECVSEVELYLFEGKHAPDLQGSLFPDEDEETELTK